MLNVTVERKSGVAIFKCRGRIVRGGETSLLCAAVRQQERELILDLTEVTAIDASGIGALVSLQAAGFYLRLVHPSAVVRDVLRLTKLDSVFEILEPKPTSQPISGDELCRKPLLEPCYAVLQEH